MWSVNLQKISILCCAIYFSKGKVSMTFVDFAPHLTSSYYSMLTAPACPHVRIPGKQLRNINVMMNYVPVDPSPVSKNDS